MKHTAYKIFLCLLLIAAVLFALAGCGKSREAADIIGDLTDIISEIPEIPGETSGQKDTLPLIDDGEPAEDKEVSPPVSETAQPSPDAEDLLPENGSYTSKEDVALYLHTYGHLPSNFITKKQAQKLGWSGGSLEDYAPGCCIGGDRFGNYEGILPKADGRVYTECDIDTLGASSRGAKRIVFSNDGLIYYTDDHYSSFTLLYGKD